MYNFDVAIIGGGASALACAVTLKNSGADLSVALFESGERLGKKLAATGNGQGNLSNADLSASHFHGGFSALAAQLAAEENVLGLFDCLFVTDRNGRIYPAGKQASALSDSLIRRAKKSGVKVFTESKVVKLEKGFLLTLENGEKARAKAVVAAFGGKAQKQFGTDGSSYALITGFGHTLTQLSPSLVQLKCDTRYIKLLKGVRADCVVSAYSAAGEKLCSTRGDVIFTDYGVSGNAVFYASAYVTAGCTLALEFLPDLKKEDIAKNVAQKIQSGYPADELLCGTLHNQIGRAVMRRCAATDPEKVAEAVKNFTLDISGSLGFDCAQVTKGGVRREEVGDDFQSKIVRGLFITGEALDLDGDCGGYNLTFALASGMRAAKGVINYLYYD